MHIHMSVYTHVYAHVYTARAQVHMREQFQKIDKNGNGLLERSELQAWINLLHSPLHRLHALLHRLMHLSMHLTMPIHVS